MKNTHLTVLTGASRGLGRAIAEQVLQSPGHQLLLCISRATDESLAPIAQQNGAELLQWSMDFADTQPPAIRLADWLKACDASDFDSVTLINNAGTVATLRPLDLAPMPDIAYALRVGLEAPMMLTGAFLRETAGWSAVRKVLSISSSAGRKPVFGQSPYCAAKAGMDHFMRVVAQEQAAQPNGARMVSIAPGNMDTDMQEELRGSNPEHFPDQTRFVRFKAEGRLQAPPEVAQKMLRLLARPDFGTEPIVYLYDFA